MTEAYLQGLLRAVNAAEPFLQHNGIRFVEVGDGFAAAELDNEPHVRNPWGVPHGGALFTMADVACGVAALSLRGESLLTLHADIDYMAPAAPEGAVRVEARVDRMGGKTCFCSADLLDARGQRIARLSATMYFTGRKLDYALDDPWNC